MATQIVDPQVHIDPVTVQVVPALEFLKDIAITAAEGGISYWALTRKYQWRESFGDARARCGPEETSSNVEAQRQDLPFPLLVIQDAEASDDTEAILVTPEHIRKGLQLALTPGIMNPESNTVKSAFRGLMEMDAGHVDSDAADCIVQLGVFGQVVYG